MSVIGLAQYVPLVLPGFINGLISHLRQLVNIKAMNMTLGMLPLEILSQILQLSKL